MARVAERVGLGGHFVPDETVRRQYRAGAANFFELYQPLVTHWKLIDNTETGSPKIISARSADSIDVLKLKRAWQAFVETARGHSND